MDLWFEMRKSVGGAGLVAGPSAAPLANAREAALRMTGLWWVEGRMRRVAGRECGLVGALMGRAFSPLGVG